MKCQAKVYTQTVPDHAKSMIQAIIPGKVERKSMIYSDKLVSSDGLLDVGYDAHSRVDHGNNASASGYLHTNMMEGFGVAKTRLSVFRGIRRSGVMCT